jgi:hypothetical protein
MRRWILPLCALAILSVISVSAEQATSTAFDGTWTGPLTVDGGGANRPIEVRIDIAGKNATQYFKNKEGGWDPVIAKIDIFEGERNNRILVWVNTGGVWSETQVFSLSLKNSKTLDLQWIRHVNNFRPGETNEVWALHGTGELTKP